MASQAHAPGHSSSATTVIGFIGSAAALITAVGGFIALADNIFDPKDPPPVTAAPTTTSLPAGGPGTGLKFSPLTDGKLTVSGSAQNDVAGMYVFIGPKSTEGGYDFGCGDVVNQKWEVEVATDGSWPSYPLETKPAYGSCPGAARASALAFGLPRNEPPPPPPPSPDQTTECLKLYGPNCLSGPGFGPPTTYTPDQ